MREHETEPVPGLPEELPRGERILWQGAPSWRALARHGFGLRLLALYFVALAVWSVAALTVEGAGAGATVAAAAWALLLGGVVLGLVAIFAALAARTTLYTVTDRRVVLRVGVALPMTINLPYSSIRSAELRRHPGGGGDIILALEAPHRISFVALWPHVRGLRLSQPQPMLRALSDVDAAAEALAGALVASLPGAASHRVTLSPAPRPAPSGANTPIPA